MIRVASSESETTRGKLRILRYSSNSSFLKIPSEILQFDFKMYRLVDDKDGNAHSRFRWIVSYPTGPQIILKYEAYCLISES